VCLILASEMQSSSELPERYRNLSNEHKLIEKLIQTKLA
jgi:hypothetical protein